MIPSKQLVPRYRTCIEELWEAWYTRDCADWSQWKHERASAELLQWSTVRSPYQVSVVPEGEVDLATADVLSTLLAEVLAERPSKVVVDLAGVSFLDSTGIKCLLAAQTAATAGGCRLVVRRPPPRDPAIFHDLRRGRDTAGSPLRRRVGGSLAS